MGLNERLARWATRSVTVLVVEVPGWSRTRCTVEAELRRRGWRMALSPADADVLVLCGQPGPRLQAAVDLAWQQLPGPRARATVAAASGVPAALDSVRARLADDASQRRDAADRSRDPAMGQTAVASQPPNDGDHMDMDDDMDIDMPMPGGIPLAGGADDRDGLEMDVLHLPLGPVLPAWPAGLLLRCTLSGDVVTEAEAEVLEPAGVVPAGESLVHGSSADRGDRAARLLTVAGWPDAAVQAARLRDDLLEAADPATLVPALDRLARRVGRSRLLRWSVSARGHDRGVDPHLALTALLRDAQAALGGTATPLSATPLERLPELVAGQQLSSVRLLVAAAELNTAMLVHTGKGQR